MSSEEPVQYWVVAVTNVPYYILSFCLWNKGYFEGSVFVFLVSIISTAYHLIPSSLNLEIADIFLAYAALIWAIITLAPKVYKTNPNWPILFAGAIALVGGAYALYKTSGDNHETSEYVWKHSFWHIGTAAAGLLLLSAAPRNESRKEVREISKKVFRPEKSLQV